MLVTTTSACAASRSLGLAGLFAYPTAVRAVSATLRALEVGGFDLRPEWLSLTDPHRLLLEVSTHIPDAVGIVENALTRSELHAVDTAQITPGVLDLIDQVTGRGQQWAWSSWK
jgi:hypothetical protein